MNWPIGIRLRHTTTIPMTSTTIKVTRTVIHIHQDLKKICTKERRPSGLWCHSALAGALSHARTRSAILLVAVAVNRVPLGMLLIVAFSIGLALILMGIGIAMVRGMRWLVHKDWLSKFGTYAPLVSAVVVVGLGAGLTVNALYSFRFSALVASAPRPSGTPVQAPSPAFELRNARVLYIAPDGAGREQLFMLPLSSGKAVQYTHEPTGINGYSISPDRKTLLYSIFDATDGSSIWAMHTDGTQRHLALECPQAECDFDRLVSGRPKGRL